MKALIRFSMKNTVALFIIVAMLIGGGIYSVQKMNIEKYPGVNIPYLSIFISYPGASPEQAANDIAEPVQREVMNIKGVENVYSDATAWGVWLTLEFAMNVNMDDGEDLARQAISRITLPDSAGQPEFMRQSPDQEPVLKVGLYADDEQTDMQSFAKAEMIPALEGIEGVADVTASGIDENQVYVNLLPEKLAQYGLTLDEVRQTILANHLSIPTGEITVNEEVLPVHVSKELRSVEDIENINVLLPQQTTIQPGESAPSVPSITLKEIADVTFGNVGQKSYTRLNAKPAVIIDLKVESGENTVAIVKEANRQLKEMNIPDDYQLVTLSDQSVSIQDSVSSMLREAILGALMAVVVTLLFLRNIRSTLIAVISIPLSILSSFLLLNMLGYTLNIMTLAGIAVAVGRVVDDSIVVIENVFRRVRAAKNRDHKLVEESTREVASAITSSTITTIAVFLPMAFVPGIVGSFFAPLAWTVVISLIFSLLTAVTIVPLLSRIFLLKIKPKQHKENRLQKWYRKTLAWALSHRAVTLILAVLLLAASIVTIAPGLGTNFLPQEETLEYRVAVSMEQGIGAERTNEIAGQVESTLMNKNDIEQIATSVEEGSASVSFKMKDSVEDPKNFVEDLRDEFKVIDGAKEITLTSTGDMTGGGQSNLVIIVNGPNIEDITTGSEQMTRALQNIEGLADISTSLEGEKPEINIDLDEQKLADHALMPGIVAQNLRSLINGDTVTEMTLDGEQTPLQLKLQLDDVDSIDTLGEQKITNLLGQEIALKELGTLERVNNRIAISHLNEKEYVMLQASITDANTGDVSNKADEALNKLDLPDGVSWYKEGASAAMAEGFQNMIFAIAISILLVYMVMVIAFGEGRTPFVILFAIPFSLIGALAGLFVVQEPIGMPAMIGIMMLNGIVVTNAIVLLDRVKHNEKLGASTREALLDAGAIRIRPILMTAIATVGALIPLAVSSDAGLVSRSLAVVVIGGLTTSTILTLIIIPVLYSLFHPNRIRSRNTKDVEEVA
ncbi:efflux RND transporter permease subunit [Bacillaceae bacterium Marseille-Q3522]|nr:efflux RND transporter permease subunit [Bacillaceae bacterium Marseille-Q3522]